VAKSVLKSAGVKVVGSGGGTTDLSDHFSELTIEDTRDEVDVTGFTTNEFREFLPGFRDVTVTLSAFQDEASGSVDSVFYPLYANSSDGTIRMRSDNASTIVHTLVFKLYSYSPIAGAVGDANTTEITLRPSGTAGLVRGGTLGAGTAW
jgi:hypothetical protein